MNAWKGKTAIVTGGSSGTGEALCHEIAVRGGHVVVAGRDAVGVQRVVSAIRKNGGSATEKHIDVTHQNDVREMVEQIADEHNGLDYMFNNAGINIIGDARDMTLKHWHQMIDNNLWSVICGTMAAYDVMVRQGYGYIVNTASMAGLLPYPTATAYATTKYAVVGLSLSLREEAADLGIQVSAVCPGFVQTKMHHSAELLNAPREEVLKFLPPKLTEPDEAARIILKGVERNRALIIFPMYANVLWRLGRIHGSLLTPIWRKLIRDFRKVRK